MFAPIDPADALPTPLALPPIRVAGDKITFAQALDDWIEIKCRGMKSWSRSCRLKARANRLAWVPILGDFNLLEITPQHVERLFLLRSETGRSGQTLNIERRYFRGFWRWAMRMRYLPQDRNYHTDSWPCATTELVRKRMEITAEEERKLLGVLSGEFRRAVGFALCMGLRVSEIYRLEWSMVVGERGCLTLVMPAEIRKQKRGHTMPISSKAETFLGTRGASNFIFTLPHQRMLLAELKTAAAKTGIDTSISMHQLRRTWCSRLADAGVPVAAAQRLGGWASVTVMLQHYYVLPPAKAREYLEKI